MCKCYCEQVSGLLHPQRAWFRNLKYPHKFFAVSSPLLARFSLGEGEGVRVFSHSRYLICSKKIFMTAIKEKARSFRKNMTVAENRMWYFLRDRRLNGYKFVREQIIGNYIADFVCRQKKLIIEVDGSQHLEAIEYDNLRTKYLMQQGYKVFRVWNNEVIENVEAALEAILDLLETV